VTVNAASIVIATTYANLDLSSGKIPGSCAAEGWPVEMRWRLRSFAEVVDKEA
jgi:hypothetical protein